MGLKLKATLDVIKAVEDWCIKDRWPYRNVESLVVKYLGPWKIRWRCSDLISVLLGFLGCSELVDFSSESGSQDQEYNYILEIHGIMKAKSDMPCNDVGWHSYSYLNSCLRVLAYGDVLSYAN
ncbi:hypothetical protein Tco_1335666 [Tanacetum coccineum]